MDRATLRDCLAQTYPETDNCVVLVETGKDATLREVTISGLPAGSYAVKVDEITVNNLFNSKKVAGTNKHSDYLIVTDRDIIAVEMKSFVTPKDEDIDDIKLKFKGDLCILNYCDSVFQSFLKKRPFFKGRKVHYVLLYKALPMMKTPTSLIPRKTDCAHIDPERFGALQVHDKSIIGLSALLHAPCHK